MPSQTVSSSLPPALAHDVGFLLARSSAMAVRATNAALASLGLRARHYALLKAAAVPGGSSQRQIGVDLGLDPSAVVALVDDLERAGLAARTPDPNDRRTRVISATERGVKMLDKADPLVAGALATVTAVLDDAEVAVLRGLLERIVGSAEG